MAMNAVGYVMNAGDHILFLVIEGNNNNKGDIQNKYLTDTVSFRYEEEAIKCIRSWKKYGVDIPIYVLCVNNNPPSAKTIEFMDELEVNYIHTPQKEAESYKSGYWNVPLAGYLLEQMLDDATHIIHIDLDMTLFKPLDLSLFDELNGATRIAINEFRPTEQNNVNIDGKVYEFEINTGFIYSLAATKFYNTWYHKLKAKTQELDWDDPSYSIWEERICDVMYFDESYQFSFFKPFQINGSLDIYNDNEIKHICFNHCHIDHVKRGHKQLEDYLKRWK